jgi:tryptophan synthase beta subunit
MDECARLMQIASETKKQEVVVANLFDRGDKDLNNVIR